MKRTDATPNWRIDLNCDCGEGIGDDSDLLAKVTSANIACGGHSGDVSSMRETLSLCRAYGVNAGAHPSFPDRARFGRHVLDLTQSEIVLTVRSQIAALAGVAADMGMALTHVKAHGALYNHAAVHRPAAEALVEAVRGFEPGLIFVGLAGSILLDVARAAGLRVAGEAFADRAYEADGTLRSRTLPNALIEDDRLALEQVLQAVTSGRVHAHDGTLVPIKADTFCLHGDTPGAARRAAFIRQGLNRAGVDVQPMTEWIS